MKDWRLAQSGLCRGEDTIVNHRVCFRFILSPWSNHAENGGFKSGFKVVTVNVVMVLAKHQNELLKWTRIQIVGTKPAHLNDETI